MTKRALILCGGWPWHYPHEMADFAEREFLGDFAVERVSDQGFLESNRLHEFDLIVVLWTLGELTLFQEQSFAKAIERGVGMVALHGTADAFNTNHYFKFVLGGQFIMHPGDIIDYTVQITNHDDPITQGLSDFKVTSEQYYLQVDVSNEVLATTTFSGDHLPWIEGTEIPVVWKRHWGKGRVFYSSIGHTLDDLAIPEAAEMVRRGVAWASR